MGGTTAGRGARHRTTARQAGPPLLASQQSLTTPHAEADVAEIEQLAGMEGSTDGAWDPGSAVFPAQYAARVQVPLPYPLQKLSNIAIGARSHGAAKRKRKSQPPTNSIPTTPQSRNICHTEYEASGQG